MESYEHVHGISSDFYLDTRTPGFEEVQKQVLKLLNKGDVILVGHGVKNDIRALGINSNYVDTLNYKVFTQKTESLKQLAFRELGVCI